MLPQDKVFVTARHSRFLSLFGGEISLYCPAFDAFGQLV